MIIALGIAAAILAFILGGTTWIVVGIVLALAAAVFALARTGQREHQTRLNLERKLAELVSREQATPDVAQAGSIPESPLPSPTLKVTSPEAQEVADGGERPTNETPSEEAAPGTSTAIAVTTPTSDDDLLGEAFLAAIDKKPNEVDRLLKVWVNATVDEAESLSRESYRLFLLAIAGQTGAIGRLRQLGDDNPTSPTPTNRLARALDFLGETAQAADELATRLPRVTEEAHRLTLYESSLRRRLGQNEQALALAAGVVHARGLTPPDAVAALAERGYAFEALNRRLEAFASFEQALELDPNNKTIRFHLAYEASQDGFKQLAIAHYAILAAQRDNGMSLNNYGAALQELGMPVLSVERYTEAVNQGVALASGNLAMRLIDVGFVTEAKSHLAKGEELESTNRMVVAATGRLSSERETELKKLERVTNEGVLMRSVMQKFDSEEVCRLPSGRYVLDEGATLDLVIDGQESKGTISGTDIELIFKQSGYLLSVTRRKGRFLHQTNEGMARSLDAEIIGFLRDLPERGGFELLRAIRRKE